MGIVLRGIGNLLETGQKTNFLFLKKRERRKLDKIYLLETGQKNKFLKKRRKLDKNIRNRARIS